MSSFKFQVGEPKKVTLAFDSPKEGQNQYGNWYLYGVKSDIDSDEDSFFATYTLHTMIQTLGCKEGDDLTIEKFDDGDIPYFKVNGLSITDMNSGGSQEKIEAVKPKSSGERSFELDLELSIRIEKLEERLEALEKKSSTPLTENDIPF